MLDVIVAIGEHLKTNQPGALQEIAAELEQAASAPALPDRELLIKSAVQTALHALAKEAAELRPEEKFAIASFVESRLPDDLRGEITLAQINAALQVVSDEIAAATAHDGIAAVRAASKWIASSEQQTMPTSAAN